MQVNTSRDISILESNNKVVTIGTYSWFDQMECFDCILYWD